MLRVMKTVSTPESSATEASTTDLGTLRSLGKVAAGRWYASSPLA